MLKTCNQLNGIKETWLHELPVIGGMEAAPAKKWAFLVWAETGTFWRTALFTKPRHKLFELFAVLVDASDHAVSVLFAFC